MYKGQENYTISSCDTIEMFYNLRVDLDKLQYAVHITKIIQDVTNENENSYKILQLFLNTLYMISETEKDKDFILSVFKMKLVSLLGFRPQIEKCTNCGSTENLNYFSIKCNGVKCETCCKSDKSCLQMTTSTYTAIKYIMMSPPKKLFSFDLKNESLKELELISKIYLNEKLEKEYKLNEIWEKL